MMNLRLVLILQHAIFRNVSAADGMPWELSKCFDGAAPLGHFIPVDSVKDINDLDFRLEINNKVVQKGNTSDMIFGINEIVEYVSRFFTLKTGDLIFTGTPPGVGSFIEMTIW